ncbi:hypothetical protein WA577_002831 [Blastocystis sp. JDR]
MNYRGVPPTAQHMPNPSSRTPTPSYPSTQAMAVVTSATEQKSRKTKSLAYLATEFVRLVRSQENETIDVLYAAGMLGVEKRRIYDITNALIGANVLEKMGKSSYRWIGGAVTSMTDGDESTLKNSRDMLEHQCADLDMLIQSFTSYLEENYYAKPDCVLTTDELVSSCEKPNPVESAQTIIAISAPPGTDVYVTNNERGRDNEIFMSSPSGQIRTYLLPSNQDNQAPIYPETVATNPSTPPMTPRIVPPEIPSSNPQVDTPMNTMNTMNGMDSMPMPSFSTDFNIQDLFL